MVQFTNINVDVKVAIIKWFTENINRWQRVISCYNAFRPYIYDSEGNYLIGGKEIGEFIEYIDKAF